MPLAELQKTLTDLRVDVAEIKPLAKQIPSIAAAMTTLAEVSAKLENNFEDHKRIHYRITDVEKDVRGLKEEFETLKEEHIVCVTTKQVERRSERTSLWTRAKKNATDKVVEITTLAIVAFAAWMVISHLKEYPGTAQLVTPITKQTEANKTK